jgi:hypothetical protein
MAKVNSFADLKIGKLKMLSTCQKKSEKQPWEDIYHRGPDKNSLVYC